jgi:hypothetical protein
MKRVKHWTALSVVVLLGTAMVVLLVTTACIPEEDEEVGQVAATTPPPGQDLCGDGLCDEVEQKNPDLCPQDCATAEPPSAGHADVVSDTGWVVTGTEDLPPSEDRCGDGACDEQERENPELCPEDCITPTATLELPTPNVPALESGPSPAPETESCVRDGWWLKVEGCGVWGGTEPAGKLCTSMQGCISAPVGETCTITGTLFGQYTACEYVSPTEEMSWDIECPDFEVPVRGHRVGDTFMIWLDPSAVLEHGVGYPSFGSEVPIDRGVVMQTAFGSALRANDGYFALAAQHGAHADFVGVDAVAPDNLRYDFDFDIHEACP